MVLLYIKDIFILVAAAVALTRPIPRWSASVAFIIALVLDFATVNLRKRYHLFDRPVLFCTLIFLAGVSTMIGIFLLLL